MGEQSMHLKDKGNSNEEQDHNDSPENMSEDENDQNGELDDMTPEGEFCILVDVLGNFISSLF